mgnify:CR=1 FL=1
MQQTTQTLLPKKAIIESPVATDDIQLEVLKADPEIHQFPSMQTAAVGNFSSLQQQPQQQPSLTQAGSNAAQDATVLVNNDNSDWINKKWRPAMGWVYMLTCTVDFVLFPILWSILQALSKGNVTSQWQPLTLQGAGLYHIAMGAVLGIAAYGRTREKIEGASK